MGDSLNRAGLRMATVLALALVVLVALAAWCYRSTHRDVRQQAETELAAIARTKTVQVADWRRERLGDASVLMENPFLALPVFRHLTTPTPDEAGNLVRLFRSLQKQYGYADVLLVDPQGNVRLNGSGTNRLERSSSVTLAASLHKRAPLFSEPYLPAPGVSPRLDLVVPLIDGRKSGSGAAGAIVLVCDLSRHLFPLVQSWPRPSVSAETLLVTRSGDDVLFLNDLRHRPGTALRLRIPLTRRDLPAAMAIRGERGIVPGRNHRGVEVTSFIEPVPDSPWYLVANVDNNEILASWRIRQVLILGLALATAGVLGAVGLVIWHRDQKLHYRALYRTEARLRESVERHSTTLRAIGDAVIATDRQGRVELLNPVAESLTGWPQAEAAGRPLKEIFRIINEETRLAVEDPVAKVLRVGAVVGLANHTLLVARDGREIPITDSAAPIRDESGAITGVVLVFHDQSGERRVQRLMQVRLNLLEYAASHSLGELLTRALDEVGRLVESPIGFYHFLEGDRQTISLQQWSSRTLREFCRTEGHDAHYPLHRAGVWADCVRESRPVVHNDYPSLAGKKGLPEGHAEVLRELVVPILRDGLVVAILGVGNKPSEYTEQDVATVSYLADVTWEIVQQKRTAEALREREAFLSTLLDGISVPVFHKDREGRYLGCNRAFETFFGASRRELVGKTVFEINPADLARIYHEKDRELYERGGVQQYESQVKDTNGELHDVIFNKARLTDRQGEISGLVGVILDISERKRAEEALLASDRALRASEERYRELVENANSIILRMDRTGTVTFFNEYAQRFFGYSEGEILGRNVVGTIVPENDSSGRDLVSMIADIGRHPELYLTNQNEAMLRDGSRVWISWSNRPLYDTEGQLREILCVGNDATERKRGEEERERLREQLSQAQKIESVGRLAGGVAHDFNNMLGVILGHAEIALLKTDPAAPLRANLQAIQKAAQHSADLTRQLLAFARKQAIAPRELDLNRTVAGMLRMLGRLIGEDIRLEWKPAPSLWPVTMDPMQIDQVLANLCINARDAITGVGRVTIATANVSCDEGDCTAHPEYLPGDFVLLEVEDDGCGMDRETQEKIFDPFFTTKELGKGTGLGLATVYGIVTQNNGFIRVRSEPGRGATFRIHLPRHCAPSRPQQQAVVEPAGSGHETILLVEDEPDILQIGTALLESFGYRVLAAGTPAEAIRLAEARREKIHLLLTDVIMPEMNGRELARRLSAIQPGITCLFMSGYTADVITRRGVLDEGVYFIQKPFSMQNLAIRVRQALDGT